MHKVSRESLSDQVYRMLKASIITGELSPGERLRDQDLAAQLGVSRTPVREALQRLEDEGLVETIPGSMTRVTPLATREAWDAFPVVAALHALATRLAAGRITEEHMVAMQSANDALRTCMERGETMGAVQADDDFHAVLVDASANREIHHALARIMPKVRRLAYSQFGSLEGQKSWQQHQEILMALKRGAGHEAASLVEENWLSLGRMLARVLEPAE